MGQPPSNFVSGRHREWVFVLSGDRIAGIRSLDAFLQAVRGGTLGIPPQIQRVRAIYVISEDDGTFRGACAFTLGFDPRGRIPQEFSLPLRELALRSGDGPDLGDGPVRLAHQAQCSIPWHSERLWGRDLDELGPWLEVAQQLLRTRLRERGGQRGGQRGTDSSKRAAPGSERGAPSARQPRPQAQPPGTVVDMAERRAEKAFGPDNTLSPRQLDEGRRIAGKRTATGEHAVVGGGKQWTDAQVEALQTRHRNEIAVLRREIELLRRRLRALETPDG